MSDESVLNDGLATMVRVIQKKSLDITFDFTDADVLEWLKRGLDTVNSFVPLTSLTLEEIKSSDLENLVLLAAASWAFQAERIHRCEVEPGSEASMDILVNRLITAMGAMAVDKEKYITV